MTTDELLLCLGEAEKIMKGFPSELDDGALEAIENTIDGFEEFHLFSAISVASVNCGKEVYGSSHLATGCRIARFLIHEVGLTPKSTALLMWDFQENTGELIDSFTFVRSFRYLDLVETYFHDRGLGTYSCESTLRTAGFLKPEEPEDERLRRAITHYIIPYKKSWTIRPSEIKRENGTICIHHKQRNRPKNKVSLIRLKFRDIGPAIILAADLFRRNAEARDALMKERGFLIEKLVRVS